MEILNAKITSTSITMADHGCLTFFVTIQGGAWGVSIGGYSIGHGYLGADEFDGYGPGLEAMMRIMDVVGVNKWEDLKDKYIRVESDGWGTRITKIGHITEDHWFDIDEFFKSKAKEAKEKEAENERKTIHADPGHGCDTCKYNRKIITEEPCSSCYIHLGNNRWQPEDGEDGDKS